MFKDQVMALAFVMDFSNSVIKEHEKWLTWNCLLGWNPGICFCFNSLGLYRPWTWCFSLLPIQKTVLLKNMHNKTDKTNIAFILQKHCSKFNKMPKFLVLKFSKHFLPKMSWYHYNAYIYLQFVNLKLTKTRYWNSLK